MAFSPAGPVLAAHDTYGTEQVVFLSTVTGQRVPIVQPIEAYWLEEIAFSPNGELIATHEQEPIFTDDESSQNNHTWVFRLLDATTGRPAADDLRFTRNYQFSLEPDEASMLFSPDSRHLAVRPRKLTPGDGVRGVYWWDLADKGGSAPRQLLTGQTSEMAFSPDSRLLAVATDGEAQVWRLG